MKFNRKAMAQQLIILQADCNAQNTLIAEKREYLKSI